MEYKFNIRNFNLLYTRTFKTERICVVGIDTETMKFIKLHLSLKEYNKFKEDYEASRSV